MDYKKSKAPVNTVTRNIMDLCDETGNIYESVAIISKRSNQIAVEIKQDLNKKLQESMGHSVTELIRTYRLTVAHEMIVNNRQAGMMNISEIAYNCGFNDPKYFTRCFSKEFGVAPSAV